MVGTRPQFRFVVAANLAAVVYVFWDEGFVGEGIKRDVYPRRVSIPVDMIMKFWPIELKNVTVRYNRAWLSWW